ncbi:MAG TPA: phosphotransferase family protein, partial [Isosphaeraceae bacterium]|nr:phosphotransferase family protein [Isosphaeraceae bacterium]
EGLGKGTGYARRQVEGWGDRYGKARTWNVPTFRKVISWLKANTPEDVATCVIHNDYRLDNVVLDPEDPTRVVGILDWEMATLGDPLMDLGTTLGYWIEAGDPEPLRRHGVGPTALPGSLTRRELVERYRQTTGRDVTNMLFHYVFGLFKIAVIAQQIYARYVKGHTRDRRFAGLNEVVTALGLGAVQAIGAGQF